VTDDFGKEMRDDHYAPGSLGCHEAMHMASVFSEMVSKNLCEHPAIKMNPFWQAKADAAFECLRALYEEIAKEHV
jgi:hypothetical protein